MAKNSDQQQGASPFVYRPDSAQVPGQDSRASAERDVASSAVQSMGGSRSDAVSVFNPQRKQKDDPGVAYGYDKSLFGHRDEVSVYTAQMDAKHSLDHRTKVIAASIVILFITFVLALILPSGLFGPGTPEVTPALIISYIQGNMAGLVNWVTGAPQTSGFAIVFWQILAVPLVGAALALNGCVYQSALNNALAAPSTLGIMSGATLGTVVYTLLYMVPESVYEVTSVTYDELSSQIASMDVLTYILSATSRALFSLAGCLVVVVLVLAIAYIAGRGKLSKVSLVIAGQVFMALVSGVISVIYAYVNRYGTEEQIEALRMAATGSFDNIVNPTIFLVMAIPLIVGIVVIMALRFKINLLAFSDDEARSMGITTSATRNAVIIICTALTGIVVSFVGSVGFVGFLIPHIARKVVGPDLRYLLPASMVFGAIFLLIANYLMQMSGVFVGHLGTLTSLVGAVAFLVIAIRERARGNIDWI